MPAVDIVRQNGYYWIVAKTQDWPDLQIVLLEDNYILWCGGDEDTPLENLPECWWYGPLTPPCKLIRKDALP